MTLPPEIPARFLFKFADPVNVLVSYMLFSFYGMRAGNKPTLRTRFASKNKDRFYLPARSSRKIRECLALMWICPEII